MVYIIISKAQTRVNTNTGAMEPLIHVHVHVWEKPNK